MFFEGLVDCVDQSSFEEKLPIIMEKWRSNDENTEALTGFCDWLLKNKVNVIRSTMLRSVREDAGLGCPPDAFYTNASECMNNVVKVKVHYKRLELPNFIVSCVKNRNVKLKELSYSGESTCWHPSIIIWKCPRINGLK